MDEGERFARALAAKDRAALLDVLAPEVDFKGLTPRRFWEAATAGELVDGVLLGQWFEPSDEIESLDEVGAGRVADAERVAYRLRVASGGGTYAVEQQAYYTVENGRIAWLRVLCSGFRPIEEAP